MISLGCVIPASLPPLATGARFTQPRDHSLADPCKLTGLQLDLSEDEREKHKSATPWSLHAMRGRRREIYLMIGGGRQIASFVTAEKVPSLAWQTAIFHREAIAEVDEVAQITYSICVQTFSSAQFST